MYGATRVLGAPIRILRPLASKAHAHKDFASHVLDVCAVFGKMREKSEFYTADGEFDGEKGYGAVLGTLLVGWWVQVIMAFIRPQVRCRETPPTLSSRSRECPDGEDSRLIPPIAEDLFARGRDISGLALSEGGREIYTGSDRSLRANRSRLISDRLAQTLKRMFPPIVTGVTVFLIGTTLVGTGFKYWGGGAACANSVGTSDSTLCRYVSDLGNNRRYSKLAGGGDWVLQNVWKYSQPCRVRQREYINPNFHTLTCS